MRILVLLSALAILLVTFFGCQQKPPSGETASGITDETAEDAIAKIAEDRDRAGSAAPLIKEKLKSDSTEYERARKLYDDAKAKNNGWVTALTYAIKYPNRNNKGKFENAASRAEAATTAFFDYANSLTLGTESGTTRQLAALGGVAVAGVLLDLGLKIYDAYGSRAQKPRAGRAEFVEQKLTWPTWSDAR